MIVLLAESEAELNHTVTLPVSPLSGIQPCTYSPFKPASAVMGLPHAIETWRIPQRPPKIRQRSVYFGTPQGQGHREVIQFHELIARHAFLPGGCATHEGNSVAVQLPVVAQQSPGGRTRTRTRTRRRTQLARPAAILDLPLLFRSPRPRVVHQPCWPYPVASWHVCPARGRSR